MADYRKMYFKLFNEVSSVIEHLQQAQQATEAMHIESDGTAVELVRTEDEE